MTVTSEPPRTIVGEMRLQRLAGLTAALSDAISVRDAAHAVAAAAVHELGADSVAVYLLSADGGSYQLAAADGPLTEPAREPSAVPVDAPVPIVEAVRDRRMIVVDDDSEPSRAPWRTHVVAPMFVHDATVIGGVSIGFAEQRRLDDGDSAFIQVAADLCAQAVHRARLFSYQQRVLARQRFLGHAATLLAAELDQDRTLHQVARLAVAELADVCAVLLFDDDHVLRPAVAVHRDAERQDAVDHLLTRQPTIANERLLQVARSREAVILPTALAGVAEEDEAHEQLFGALGASSAIVAPMRARGRVLGLLLMLTTAGQQELDDNDRTVAQKLATWSALALDNARLYAEQVELVDHLQVALGSHRAIEQAKGILATRLGISPTEAFNHMRRHARAHRRKMEDLADDVVAGRDDLDA